MIILWYVWSVYKFYALVSLYFGCIMCLMIVLYALRNLIYVMGIKIFWSLRVRLCLRYKFIY